MSVPVVKLIVLSFGLKGYAVKSPVDNTTYNKNNNNTRVAFNWEITEGVKYSSTYFESIFFLRKL